MGNTKPFYFVSLSISLYSEIFEIGYGNNIIDKKGKKGKKKFIERILIIFKVIINLNVIYDAQTRKWYQEYCAFAISDIIFLK